MNIIIDIENETPLFTQLVDQIKQTILNGDIKPGDSLPSIRQLANDLNLNNKTVAKAYQLLEKNMIIQAKGYRGSFIHPDAVKNCEFDIDEWAQTKLENIINELREGGATDSQIRNAFTQLMKQRY